MISRRSLFGLAAGAAVAPIAAVLPESRADFIWRTTPKVTVGADFGTRPSIVTGYIIDMSRFEPQPIKWWHLDDWIKEQIEPEIPQPKTHSAAISPRPNGRPRAS